MGNFVFTPTEIDEVFVVEPRVFGDERGYFMETYSEQAFREAGLNYVFVQEHPQAKLVRVLSGEVFDVAVDLRAGSPTYGKWVGELLTADNHKQLMIPRGFAHGFLVVSEMAEFAYKCDDFYHPEDEGGVMYDSANIEWPEIDGELILSEKDLRHPKLDELDFKFEL